MPDTPRSLRNAILVFAALEALALGAFIIYVMLHG
jgi:hypothetical protein